MYRFEKNPINQEEIELVIDGWENGTAASPEQGVNIVNCNIESVPGTVRPNWQINQESIPNNLTFTFTADFTTNIVTISGTNASTTDMDLQQVQVSNSGGALPSGLATSTKYWLSLVGGRGGNFGARQYYLSNSLANAVAGTPVALIDNGTGTQSVSNSAYRMFTINWMLNVPVVTNGLSTFYAVALDYGGNLWVRIPTTSFAFTWIIADGNGGSGTGNGLSFFVSSGAGGTTIETYIFVVKNNNVDVLNFNSFIVSPSSASWTNNWFALQAPSSFSSIEGEGNHMAYLAQDNKVYICDRFFIASIAEIATKNFNPSDATTYTQNAVALTLPNYSQAQCLEELATNLLVGDKNTNRIYPWDKQSTNFGQPLRTAENNIYRMKNVDNTIYALAGTKGHVYETTGYSFTREMKIPEYLSGLSVTWGGMEKLSGALLFGVLPTVTTSNQGIYKLYTDVGAFAGSVKGSIILDEQPMFNGSPLYATAILSDNTPDEFYWVGTFTSVSNSEGGIFVINSTNRLANYEAYVESDLIPVGTVLQPRTFNSIEYKLDFAPSSGGVRLSWRTNLNASYTVIKDFNCAGIISDIQTPANITSAQFLQIKAELKGGTGFNTPRLRELRLR